jgi:hypothetical protein
MKAFDLGTRWRLSGLLHTLAILPLRKGFQYTLNRREGGHQNLSQCLEEDNNLRPLSEDEAQSSIP